MVVDITRHAVEQARERFPELGLSDARWRGLIETEVTEAIDQYRMALKIPRFAMREFDRTRTRIWRNHRERARSMRFLWTDDEQRVYLIDRRHGLERVITVIRPPAADTRQDVAA